MEKLYSSVGVGLKSIGFDEFQERFSLNESIDVDGLGDFPVVLNGRDNQKKITVAIKFFSPNSKSRNALRGSLKKRIGSISGVNLVSPYEYFSVQEPSQSEAKKEEGKILFHASVYLFQDQGNLAEFSRKNPSVQDKSRIVEGILAGLKTLHGRKIIHGNLKPTNILIQDVGHPHVRLSDYGLDPQQVFSNLNVSFQQGAINYFAPELLDSVHHGSGRQPGYEVDFWAFGVILYELIIGEYPFGKSDDVNTQIASRICLMDLEPVLAKVPPKFRDSIQACLERSPASRIKSVKELRQLLPVEFGGTESKKKSQPSIKLSSLKRLFNSPAKEKIKCKSCGNLNEPGRSICRFCKNPLGGPSTLSLYKSPSSIGALAGVFFTLLLVPIVISYWEVYQICDFNNGDCNFYDLVEDAQATEVLTESELVQGVVLLVFFALGYLLYITFFTWWLNRANENLKAFGSEKSNAIPYYPIMGVLTLGFFFPDVQQILGGKFFLVLAGVMFILIAASFKTLQQIWKGSNPAFLIVGEGWKKSKGSFLIVFRWALSFLFPIFLILPFIPSTSNMEISKAWFFFWVGMSLLYWVLTMIIISRISLRQRAKFRALAKR